MTWQCTELKQGPLTNNSYTIDITGLTPSTKYRYRAYFVVDGVEYYGNILTGTTASISITTPTVITGEAYHDLDAPSTAIRVYNNCISNNGNAPIQEYGVLYTKSIQFSCDNCLIIENYPNYVMKKSLYDDGQMNPYFIDDSAYSICNLESDTTYYYRAYAKNAAGYSYGSVKNIKTESPPSPPINIEVNITWNDENNFGRNDGFGGSFSIMCCDNSLISTHTIPSYSKNRTCLICLNAGCYYIDLNNIEARIDYNLISYDIEWSLSCNGFETIPSICPITSCFNGDVTISVSLPNFVGYDGQLPSI